MMDRHRYVPLLVPHGWPDAHEKKHIAEYIRGTGIELIEGVGPAHTWFSIQCRLLMEERGKQTRSSSLWVGMGASCPYLVPNWP